MLSVPPNTATENSFDKQAIRSLFRRKAKNKQRSVSNKFNSSNHSLNCPNGGPGQEEGFARSSSSVLNSFTTLPHNGDVAHPCQQSSSRLNKSRSLLNVLRHRRRTDGEEKQLNESNRPKLFSRILSKSRSPLRQTENNTVRTGADNDRVEASSQPSDKSVDQKYEVIRNRYIIKPPSGVKLDNGTCLSKTSQSTVKIACLLNGYTALRPPVVGSVDQRGGAKHFDFEPFYSLASRRGRPEPPKKSADDKCDQCGQLAFIADSFDKSLTSALEDLKSADKDGHSFRLKADAVAAELEEKCQEYDRLLSQSDLPEDARGNVQAAIGQARLLQNQKINQFRQLCSDNVNGVRTASNRETTNEDLAGFWDLLTIQVDKCKAAFESLDKQRQNGWVVVAEQQRQLRKPAPKASPRSRQAIKSKQANDGPNELRELIRQRRRNLKNEQQAGAARNQAKSSASAEQLDAAIEEF